jgi:hypothetical protein
MKKGLYSEATYIGGLHTKFSHHGNLTPTISTGLPLLPSTMTHCPSLSRMLAHTVLYLYYEATKISYIRPWYGKHQVSSDFFATSYVPSMVSEPHS